MLSSPSDLRLPGLTLTCLKINLFSTGDEALRNCWKMWKMKTMYANVPWQKCTPVFTDQDCHFKNSGYFGQRSRFQCHSLVENCSRDPFHPAIHQGSCPSIIRLRRFWCGLQCALGETGKWLQKKCYSRECLIKPHTIHNELCFAVALRLLCHALPRSGTTALWVQVALQ